MTISNPRLEGFQIAQEDIIHFEDGMMGFENVHNYVLLEDEDIPFIMNLQSVNEEHPCFVVMDPYAVLHNYSPQLSTADAAYFKGKSVDQLKFLVVTVLTKDPKDTVVNMKSPIVIDFETRRARQVVLENDGYSIRYFLFRETK